MLTISFCLAGQITGGVGGPDSIDKFFFADPPSLLVRTYLMNAHIFIAALDKQDSLNIYCI